MHIFGMQCNLRYAKYIKYISQLKNTSKKFLNFYFTMAFIFKNSAEKHIKFGTHNPSGKENRSSIKYNKFIELSNYHLKKF